MILCGTPIDLIISIIKVEVFFPQISRIKNTRITDPWQHNWNQIFPVDKNTEDYVYMKYAKKNLL